MPITFSKATKRQSKLRLALIGPSGSGKTYSALAIATGLGGRIALIDTEHGSASKYAGLFSFDCFQPETFAPETYIEAIQAAAAGGYDVLVIDSLSHAWAGKGGILEFVDRQRAASGDAFGSGWRKATPKHNQLVDAILAAPLHVIATMRSKTEYIVEQEAGGKTRIRKVGMQPVQREGIEFEFDLCGDLDQDNTLTVTKSRCPGLSGAQIESPGAQMAAVLTAWLTDGAPPATTPAVTPTASAAAPADAGAPQQTPEQTMPAANGHTRPYTAEQLRARFAEIVAAAKATPMKEGMRGLVAAWLDLAFVGQPDVEQKRHSVTRYLTGKPSLSDTTPQALRAFRAWLQPIEDTGGAWRISALAEQEAQRVISQVMRDAGQSELPLASDDDADDPADLFGAPEAPQAVQP